MNARTCMLVTAHTVAALTGIRICHCYAQYVVFSCANTVLNRSQLWVCPRCLARGLVRSIAPFSRLHSNPICWLGKRWGATDQRHSIMTVPTDSYCLINVQDIISRIAAAAGAATATPTFAAIATRSGRQVCCWCQALYYQSTVLWVTKPATQQEPL